MPDLEAVSSGTEATESTSVESSTPSTQAAEQPASQPTTESNASKPASLADIFKQYPELESELHANTQRAIAKAQRRWTAQSVSKRAEAALTNQDADAGFAALQDARQLLDQPDEDEAVDVQWAEKATRVRPQLDRLLKVDKTGQATNGYYVQLHQKVGKAEMDQRYASDPEAFVDWVTEQIDEIRLDAKLKKLAPSLYKAGQTDAANTALKATPAVPTGASTAAQSDDDFITAYSQGRSDDHARWRKISARLR